MTTKNKLSVYLLLVVGVAFIIVALFTGNPGYWIAGPLILLCGIGLLLWFRAGGRTD
jgi:uncharacterized membrane protein